MIAFSFQINAAVLK